jgi:hypothetical protein
MKLDIKLFFYLTFGFIIATIVGTLSHEFGHYFVAKLFGFDCRINFASTQFTNGYMTVNSSQSFWILAGGPLETIFTGSLGVLLLFIYRSSFQNSDKLNFRQWVIVYISLFWLRPVANFFVWVISYLFTGQLSERSDEIRIANQFNLPIWLVSALSAAFGIMVLTLVIFKFIPQKQRITFMAAGLVGGISGYIFWLILIGPIIMP